MKSLDPGKCQIRYIFQTTTYQLLPIQQKEPLKVVELISSTVCRLQGTKWDICQKKVS